jgi:hypothetical protein
MPTTVSHLLEVAGLQLAGVVPWSTPLPTNAPGVYIVSLSPDPNQNARVQSIAPIDRGAVQRWIARVPDLELDGSSPAVADLANHLSEFWLPDESTLYIGKASSLRNRVRGYYKTPLGDRRPHAGGHWIKTLMILSETFVYFAESTDPENVERLLMLAFLSGVSPATRFSLRDPCHPFPFANLEFPQGPRKAHAIAKSKLGD